MKLLPRSFPFPEDISLAWCTLEGNHSKDMLSLAEKKEWSSFTSSARRREYLATRGLIYEMIQQNKLNTDLFQLKKDELGKPYGLYNDTTYHISIAHTREHVLCGMSPKRAVGVDLEPCSRKTPERLKIRIVNDREKPLLENEPTLRIWTLKEALVKLQGRGMRTNLNDCTLLTKTDYQFTAKFDDEKRANICSFIYENNWLALAWNC